MYSWPAQVNPILEGGETIVLFGALIIFSLFALAIVLLLARTYRKNDGARVDSTAELPVASNETDATDLSAPHESLKVAPDSSPIFAQVFSLNEVLPRNGDEQSGGEWQNAAIGEEYIPEFHYPEPQEGIAGTGESDTVSVEYGAGQVLANLNARTYLEQVNQHVLMERGSIIEEPGELKLSWQTTAGLRSIAIAARNEQVLTINGIPFEASADGVKTGIAASLKSPDNS